MYVVWRAPRRKFNNRRWDTRCPELTAVVVMQARGGAIGFMGRYNNGTKRYAPNISE